MSMNTLVRSILHIDHWKKSREVESGVKCFIHCLNEDNFVIKIILAMGFLIKLMIMKLFVI